MPAHLHGSNFSFGQGGRSSSLGPLEGNPSYANPQDISINPNGSVRYPRRQAQESSVGASLDPQMPAHTDWYVPQTTAAQKRQRPDEYTGPPSKRTRGSRNLDILEQQQVVDQPWSTFASGGDQVSEVSSIQRSLAVPSTRKRSQLSQTSGSEQQGVLLSTTNAEDISKALISEVKSCKSWEGIQRTIKKGLLNLLKPDSLKALDSTSAGTFPIQGNAKRGIISCDVCGKTMNRHCELKSVVILYPISSFLSSTAFPLYRLFSTFFLSWIIVAC